MKISWLRAKNDDNSFKVLKNLGFDVYNVEDEEKTDEVINNLVQNDYKIEPYS